jgi:uncharacterized integral membrane protein
MGMYEHILGVIRSPATTLRSIKRSSKFGEAWLVLIGGLILSGLISSFSVINLSRSADTGTIFMQAMLYDIVGALIAFLAFIFVAHIFFRALEHKGNWKKHFMLQVYPFVTFKVLTGMFGGLAILAGGTSTTLDAGAMIGFVFTFFAILASIYAIFVYVLAARENYGASLAQCTVVILIAALLTFYLSILSLVNLAGLTGGSPY